MFALSEEPLENIDLKGPLVRRDAGACVEFRGMVRDANQGKEVSSLEYQAYAGLAEKEGTKILKETTEKFEVLEARCLHRTGHLQIGDLAVWVGVVSVHRSDAFAACKYIIDELKQRLPIWKKEHYTNGDSGWIRSDSPSAPATGGDGEPSN